MLKVSVSAVDRLVKQPDFPASVGKKVQARLWNRHEVLKWHVAYKEKRKPGKRSDPEAIHWREFIPEAFVADAAGLTLFELRDAVAAGKFPPPDSIGAPGFYRKERLWRPETIAAFVKGGRHG